MSLEFNWKLFLDLALVFGVTYQFLLWIKHNHSLNLIRGLSVVLLIYVLSHVLGLTTLNWLLEKFATVLILLVIIIFQPELRRLLEKIGRGYLFSPALSGEIQDAVVIKRILRAVETLSKSRIGALIVIEVGANLSEYIESGILIDGNLSSELLINLFTPNTPTHDGAVFIRENKIVSAGCLLPLTDSRIIDRRLGTRHRAALGLSEVTDALVIVISEETGIMSIAENGNLTRFLNKEALEARLFNLYSERPSFLKSTDAKKQED